CQQIALAAAAGKGVGPGIMPHIAAFAAKPAKLDIVAVPLAAMFEHKDKLVLAAVERPHPAIVLDPNTEVLQLVVGGSAGRQQLLEMAPVHADEVQRTADAECHEVAESLAKKAGEFGSIHLARGHREGPMVDRAETTRMTIDRHIIRRVGEHHRGAFFAQQRLESRGIERAAAEHAMATEQPEIPDLADRRAR